MLQEVFNRNNYKIEKGLSYKLVKDNTEVI